MKLAFLSSLSAKTLCVVVSAGVVSSAYLVVKHSSVQDTLSPSLQESAGERTALPTTAQTLTSLLTTAQTTVSTSAAPTQAPAEIPKTYIPAALPDYSKVKGNAITDGDDYTIAPEQEKEEDPEYDAPAVEPTEELTDSIPEIPETATLPQTSEPQATQTQPSTTEEATVTTITTQASTAQETSEPTTVPVSEQTQESTTVQSSTIVTSAGTSAAPSSTTQKPTTTAAPTTTKPQPPQNGWYSQAGKRYYYYQGVSLKGFQTIGGVKYYFEPDGALSSKVGIDVSKWDGNIDWVKVKAAGVDFAFIRVGYRGYGSAGNIVLDEYFKQNILGANAVGIDCGVYFYTQAITTAEAQEEAAFVLKAIEGFRLTYPVAYDIEAVEGAANPRTKNLTTKQRTDFSIAFCDTIKKAGFYPMIYANKYWLTSFLDTSRLAGYDIWLAHYTNMTDYAKPYRVWQYTDTGTISGITGGMDRNIGLFDYASYLKQNGWNGLT